MNIIAGNTNGLPMNIVQNINQMKQIKAMCNGNMQELAMRMLSNNPQAQQFINSLQGQNMEQVVRAMCQQKGIDFNAFMNALK